MDDPFDLDRFVQAQAPVLASVRRELAEGRKRSHWMWFVFPQFAGLGHSDMARQYAIASLAEARAYLGHAVLGPRLMECTALVNTAAKRSIMDIFDRPDDLKFHSSMTLFTAVESDTRVFQEALDRYFSGCADLATNARLPQSR